MELYIAGAARTAIGSFGGSLKDISAADLGCTAVTAALQRAGVTAEQVGETYLGCVLSAGQGQNPARQAALKAGIPEAVCATTVNMVCGSGLKSVMLAAQSILTGESEIAVAGGMESMSRVPYLLTDSRFGMKMGHKTVVDSMIQDGLWCAFGDTHMGITAENIAERYSITREEQDAFAAASQQKAAEADFSSEIVPVDVRVKKEIVPFAKDEYIRPGTTAETLAKLRPAFKGDGTVTAGNASGINDGAAALVICSGEAVQKYGLKPIAKILSFGQEGVAPEVMGLGPVGAVTKALNKANLTIDDIDLIELNEAFAAQSIAVMRDLKADPAKTNVKGGAIALGHPIGASGARILVTLLHTMQERNAKKGLASLCIGGGMGIATVVELV